MVTGIDLGLFEPSGHDPITKTLQRLADHLDLAESVIVGSVAMSHALATASEPREFNDIDICVRNVDAIRPSVSEVGYITHFLWEDVERTRPYVVIVDKVTKTKTDVFSPPVLPTADAMVSVGGANYSIIGADQLLVGAVRSLKLQIERERVKPHRIHDVELLLRHADVDRASTIWKIQHGYDTDLVPEIDKARQTLTNRPELFVEIEFPETEDAPDTNVVDERFPLTPTKDLPG